jgi:hypothetical protein
MLPEKTLINPVVPDTEPPVESPPAPLYELCCPSRPRPPPVFPASPDLAGPPSPALTSRQRQRSMPGEAHIVLLTRPQIDEPA